MRNALGIYRTGSLSCTHTKWVHKLDFPHADWPMASFPAYKYPVEKHRSENSKKDATSLREVVTVVEVARFHVKVSIMVAVIFSAFYF